MRSVNIHEAKTQLSRLVEAAARGERFIIAKAGKPMVKVVAIDAPAAGAQRRLGFLVGAFSVPEDFDRMGAAEVEALFRRRGVRLLLDTHLLLWAAAEPERLPVAAAALIEDEGNALVFSAASLWEVAIKAGLGRADFTADAGVLRRGLVDNGYEELAVTGAHAAAVAACRRSTAIRSTGCWWRRRWSRGCAW